MKIKRTRPLTARQREVFDFIERFITEIGYPPTIREIAAGFGFSEKASHDHLIAIEKKGYFHRENGSPRSIRIAPFARMFSIEATSTLKDLAIEKGDVLTVNPAVSPVVGDLVMLADGEFTRFKDGQASVGKVIGLSRQV